MRYFYNKKYLSQIKKIIKTNKVLYKKIVLTLEQHDQNPAHNSLRRHKLAGKLSETWSINVDRSIRIIVDYPEPGVVILLAVGKHEEVY